MLTNWQYLVISQWPVGYHNNHTHSNNTVYALENAVTPTTLHVHVSSTCMYMYVYINAWTCSCTVLTCPGFGPKPLTGHPSSSLSLSPLRHSPWPPPASLPWSCQQWGVAHAPPRCCHRHGDPSSHASSFSSSSERARPLALLWNIVQMYM